MALQKLLLKIGNNFQKRSYFKEISEIQKKFLEKVNDFLKGGL